MATPHEDDANALVVQALKSAVEQAGRAPSILNTQPWRWRLPDGVLELYADRNQQVTSIDPHGRLLTLSCGAALHHARVALAASGHEPAVTRFPIVDRPDLLAEVRVAGPHAVRPTDVANRRSIRLRRSDRRPIAADRPVPAETLAALHAVAEAEHTWLHHVSSAQITFLAAAVDKAQAAEANDRHYAAELRARTQLSRASGEGIPPETIMAPVSRPVPVRDFAPDGGETMVHPGFGDDRYVEYLVLVTEGDGPVDWLHAGEATSAVWLAATGKGLAVSVMSDVVEVPDAREQLRNLLRRNGCPQLVLRVGIDVQPTPPPATPRRAAIDDLDLDTDPLAT